MEGIWGWEEPRFLWFQGEMWIVQHCLCLPKILNPILFFLISPHLLQEDARGLKLSTQLDCCFINSH